MGYLENLLDSQRLSVAQLDNLRSLRENVELILTGGWNVDPPRFYYGGSFAKKTMIAADYDLDIIIYFPPSASRFSLKEIYEAVEQRLQQSSIRTTRKNVAIRIPFQGGFSIDVVPGRAIANDYQYAQLYASSFDTTKQTSIKTHLDLVRANGGYQDVVRLLKLWKLRHNIDLTSFVLELAVNKALAGDRNDLEKRFWKMLQFLRDDFERARLVDPANSNNIVSDEITLFTKRAVAQKAAVSLAQQSWNQIVW